MKIFSKITSNEYNNRLERILDNKTFNENVKNLLLSMLYKIENGYSDYYKVKFNAISREDFMENILNIVENQCFEITVVTPGTELSRPLEEEDTVCKIDIDKGSILVYENEEDLLYSLVLMNILDEEYKKRKELEKPNETYYEKAIKEFILKAVCLNDSEIIRDFDGWSWNNNIKTNKNIEYNLIFQNIMMLGIDVKNVEFYNQNFEKALIEEQSFEKSMYTMILTVVAENNTEIKTIIKNRFHELQNILELMENKKAFLDKVTEKKKNICNDIKNIDEKLNDKIKLKKEYDKRNSTLPNREKIFSVSYLEDILENERKEKLEELKSINNFLEPSKYVKQKTKIENEMNLLKNVVENVEHVSSKQKEIINMQIEFLKRLSNQIEQNSNNKEYLEKAFYMIRYYCLIPISKEKCIRDITELEKDMEKFMNLIIDNCIDKEIITNFSNSASLCYNILKYVFITKIIDLKEVQIKINKIKEEKYVNEIQYDISVSICDSKETENVYHEIVYNLNLLNVRTNKRISLFLK